MERTAERMGAREIDRLCPAVGAALEAFLPSLQERERLALQDKSVARRAEGIALADEVVKQYRREGRFFDEILGGI